MSQAKTADELFAAYNALTDNEKHLLNLLAVAYHPLALSDIIRALKHLKQRVAVEPLFEPLSKRGLLKVSFQYNSAKLCSCAPAVIECIARQLVKEGKFLLLAQAVEFVAPLPRSYFANVKYTFSSVNQLIRYVRMAFYLRDFARIEEYYSVVARPGFYMPSQNELTNWQNPAEIFALICGNPFDRAWFLALPRDVVDITLPQIALNITNQWLEQGDEVAALLADGCAGKLGRAVPVGWPVELARWQWLRGDCDACAATLAPLSDQTLLHFWLKLLREGADACIADFTPYLAAYRKQQGKRKAVIPGTLGAVYLLALWLRNQGTDAREAETYHALWAAQTFRNTPLKACLEYVPALMRNDVEARHQFANVFRYSTEAWRQAPLEFMLAYLLAGWLDRGTARQYVKTAMECLTRAVSAGMAWPAEELSALISELEPQLTELKTEADVFEAEHGFRLLTRRFHYQEPWAWALQSLSQLGAAKTETAAADKSAAEVRLAWQVDKFQARPTTPAYYELEAREQKRTSKGWSKGKTVSFKKLVELSSCDATFLSKQDHQMVRHISNPVHANSYILDERAWLALVGHPYVYWGDSGQPLELVTGQPELLVKKLKQEQVKISLIPPYQEGQSVVLWQETPTRLRVIEITDAHRRIGQVLGKDGIEVPLSAREQVLEALGAVSSLVMVHSDIGGVVTEGEAVVADSQPRVHLLPEGAGLRVEILVRPFGGAGPYFPPGTGGKALFTEVDGKRLHTERDLKGEKKLAQHLVDACAVLAHTDSVQDFAWQLEEAETCLELLLQLQSLPEHALIEWPQGERFKLAGQAGLKQLSVKVRAARDWFSLSGEIRLDSGQVLNMQRLLELMGNGESRFIQLDDGHFLALTDAFRKRLADLNALAEIHGKERRIHALAAPLLEELAEEAGEFVSDKAWRERIARLRAAETLQPVLPSNLQAELRDYQVEGYHWLARLAHWGVGACLADDMGLGKTLQALALILSRAPEGPSLVIAPTSVCLNWHSETVRFAPTLKVNVLGAGDRQKQIEALGAMDLLICSYALLQQSSVADMLSGIVFRTIVLDEAQAIKNMTTKRSQSAMNLQGDFKLITTGTPVENHLGELWNLFRFINPGLLGSLESFNRRFAGPIERGEKDARQSLKRLVQAFVLRRLKSQVLDELPSRTEITLTVELSEQERAFYEALRRQAMAELERSDAKQGGEKHLQVLVAIMKLRRACCHSSLATPGISLPSSKLALFGETLEELLANRHKALVFSQFIDHLALIRAHLDEKGISYQYLDGQTPAAERKKRVDAFQAGQGDVFLISLKAGGVGLNLTAADYVIHMDPWWNPAVEDQASDRAHRMGQIRPVTIYRLVAKDTIEEKIVALHRHKRDLADSVLSGSDSGGKISTDELLRLIREA